MGADNQQGRPDESGLAHYIAGFVDGEGSFHVAVQRNASVKTKWQLVPEFHVSQHESSKECCTSCAMRWDVDTSSPIIGRILQMSHGSML
jgi:hypothetical protein